MFDSKKYYQENKEVLQKRARGYYHKNKDTYKKKRQERVKRQRANGTYKYYNWFKTENGKRWLEKNRPRRIKTPKTKNIKKTWSTKRISIIKQKKEILIKRQNNCCAICGESFNNKKRACLDHCHKTTIIRGVLCAQCNSVLGFAYDDICILKNAINYLQKFNND